MIFSNFSVICDFWCFLCVIFVCDFFVIPKEVYKKKSVICPFPYLLPRKTVSFAPRRKCTELFITCPYFIVSKLDCVHTMLRPTGNGYNLHRFFLGQGIVFRGKFWRRLNFFVVGTPLHKKVKYSPPPQTFTPLRCCSAVV